MFLDCKSSKDVSCVPAWVWRSKHSSVQSLSRVRFFATPWTASLQVSLFITNFRSLLKLMSIESLMLTDHLIVCQLLLLPPSIFSRVSSSDQVAKVLEFQLQYQYFQ